MLSRKTLINSRMTTISKELVILHFLRALCLLVLPALVCPTVRAETAPPFEEQRIKIERIWEDAITPEAKDRAASELLRIVINKKADIHLREFAARKLGEVGDANSMETLSELGSSIDWSDDYRRQLKKESILAYHKIRYSNQPTTEAAVKSLIDSLVNPVADEWAIEQLVLRGEEGAIPQIIERINCARSGEEAKQAIQLLKAKFKVMNDPEGAAAALEEVIKSFHSSLKSLSPENQTRLKDWALDTKERLMKKAREGEMDKHIENLK